MVLDVLQALAELLAPLYLQVRIQITLLSHFSQRLR